MNTYKFKTNINCGGCIKKVSPFLNELNDTEWKVDIEDNRKLLEVKSASVTENQVIETVHRAGFEIEPLKEGIWRKLFN